MASFATACRLSARQARCQLSGNASSRGFHARAPRRAAQNFVMPAMSPTMTEGNIASWKVKEGDSYSVGDVLLEIETDKAQMDVEAQDDGVLAKIMQGDGTKSIQVGSRIAVLAEQDDDLDSLEIPSEDTTAPPSSSAESAQQDTPPETPTSQESPPSEPSKPTPTDAKPQKQHYPLYPSVQALLREAGLSPSDASNIPATGPSGRLLKGDVLAHLGRIDAAYASDLSKRLAKLTHLDLSNARPAAATTEAKPAPETDKPAPIPAREMEAERPPAPTELALPVSLAAVLAVQQRIDDALGIHLPLSTFVARATDLANEDLPQARSLARATPDPDALFASLVGVPASAPRAVTAGRFVPQVLPPAGTVAAAAPRAKPDPFDVLTGVTRAVRRPSAPMVAASEAPVTERMFYVTARRGEERRAQVFLERLKVALEGEPGRLVL